MKISIFSTFKKEKFPRKLFAEIQYIIDFIFDCKESFSYKTILCVFIAWLWLPTPLVLLELGLLVAWTPLAFEARAAFEYTLFDTAAVLLLWLLLLLQILELLLLLLLWLLWLLFSISFGIEMGFCVDVVVDFFGWWGFGWLFWLLVLISCVLPAHCTFSWVLMTVVFVLGRLGRTSLLLASEVVCMGQQC